MCTSFTYAYRYQHVHCVTDVIFKCLRSMCVCLCNTREQVAVVGRVRLFQTLPSTPALLLTVDERLETTSTLEMDNVKATKLSAVNDYKTTPSKQAGSAPENVSKVSTFDIPFNTLSTVKKI